AAHSGHQERRPMLERGDVVDAGLQHVVVAVEDPVDAPPRQVVAGDAEPIQLRTPRQMLDSLRRPAETDGEVADVAGHRRWDMPQQMLGIHEPGAELIAAALLDELIRKGAEGLLLVGCESVNRHHVTTLLPRFSPSGLPPRTLLVLTPHAARVAATMGVMSASDVLRFHAHLSPKGRLRADAREIVICGWSRCRRPSSVAHWKKFPH